MSHQPVTFPDWKAALAGVSLAPAAKAPHAREIIIRTVRALPGHASVETTQVYTHVMKKPGLGMRSPLDQ